MEAKAAKIWTGAALLGVIVSAAYVQLVQTGKLPNPIGPADPLGAIAVCEKSLQDRLVAPSTYRRISAKSVILPVLTKDEYRAYLLSAGCEASDNPHVCRDLHRDGLAYAARDPELRKKQGIVGEVPRTRQKSVELSIDAGYKFLLRQPAEQQRSAAVEIVYDAANSYNTPIRSTNYCRLGPIFGGTAFSSDRLFDPTASYED